MSDNIIQFPPQPGIQKRLAVPMEDALKALGQIANSLPGKAFIIYSDNNETRCISSSNASYLESLGMVKLGQIVLENNL